MFNPYDPSVMGVGYLGEGEYLVFYENTHIQKPSYFTWYNMLRRCYNEKDRHKHLAYADCYVCEEWLNYQNFAAWFEANYYDVNDGKRMHIDKDILIKNNKVYSPDRCLIVPQRINMIFMEKSRTVDSDLPNGIRRCATGYSAEYNTKRLGTYKDFNDAFECYLKEKRIHIKTVANEYKEKLPSNVYDALINW